MNQSMKEIQFGNNDFCGPSVISTVCNITTDEAEKIINKVLNRNESSKVKGLYVSELRNAFVYLGYDCQTVNLPKGTTLFSAMFHLNNQNGIYIFMIPGHFVAIEINGSERFICDNHTKRPLTLVNSSRLGDKVNSVFKVSRRLN